MNVLLVDDEGNIVTRIEINDADLRPVVTDEEGFTLYDPIGEFQGEEDAFGPEADALANHEAREGR